MGLTDTGGFVGSPLYMSPEQVQSSKDVDARADVWSLGCVLYATIAGRAPHQDIESLGRLVIAICSTPAPPLRDVAPGVPEEVAAVVHRALAIDPKGRTPSAAAMLEAIRALSPGGLALHEEMLPSLWTVAHADTVPPNGVRPASDAGSTWPDTTSGGQETSRSTGTWSAGRRTLPVLAAVLALGVGGALGYLLSRPDRRVASAALSSPGSASASPPASSGASTVVKDDAASKPAAFGELSARATPPSATAPRAPVVAKAVKGAAVVRPPAVVVPVAPPTSPPKRTADPLIPADPP
jgi:serine/threonine-protein kinase